MAVAKKTPRTERRNETSRRGVAGHGGAGRCGANEGGRSSRRAARDGGTSRVSASAASTQNERPASRRAEPTRAKRSVKRPGLARRAKLPRLPKDPDDWLSLTSEELLTHYLRSRRDDLRNALVDRHLPDVAETARCLAARLPKSVDIEDLCNAGYSGLLRSFETFDIAKGRTFLSYLRTRAYGSMVDELRAMDWLPRLMRSRLVQRDQVVETLKQDLGRDPSDEEVAGELGVDLATYRRSYPSSAAGAAGIVSREHELDRLDGNIVGLGVHGSSANEEVHPLTPMYQQELIERIQELLTQTEWALVDFHYFQGLNLREVAARLSLSPARICQIHGHVLQRLKERLREEAPTI